MSHLSLSFGDLLAKDGNSAGFEAQGVGIPGVGNPGDLESKGLGVQGA